MLTQTIVIIAIVVATAVVLLLALVVVVGVASVGVSAVVMATGSRALGEGSGRHISGIITKGGVIPKRDDASQSGMTPLESLTHFQVMNASPILPTE